MRFIAIALAAAILNSPVVMAQGIEQTKGDFQDKFRQLGQKPDLRRHRTCLESKWMNFVSLRTFDPWVWA